MYGSTNLREIVEESMNSHFTPAKMREMVNKFVESDNIPSDVHERLITAFTKETEVGYRLHVDPDHDIVDVFVNEVFIIQLKGKDPFSVGRKFLEIITKKLFNVPIVSKSNSADDYERDI